MTTKNEGTQRDELARIIRREYTRAIDRRRPTDAYTAPADAIYSAGYRKPRTIMTVEELDALPDRAIVKDRCGPVERHTSALSGERGWFVGDSATTPRLPVIVLWEPEAEVGA